MLAQGGVLIIKDDSLVFAPRAFERAMGASDVNISFDEVKMAEVTGTITESLLIRTPKKVHRFVGSDLYRILDLVNSSLQTYQLRPARTKPPVEEAKKPEDGRMETRADPTPAQSAPAAGQNSSASGRCPSCSGSLRAEFNFCPFCKAAIKTVCPSCRQAFGPGWKFCAFCGHTV